jgi:hypothetical protein
LKLPSYCSRHSSSMCNEFLALVWVTRTMVDPSNKGEMSKDIEKPFV